MAAEARSVGAVELVDPEGLPLARVSWPGGVVDPLTHAEFGPFRELVLAPAAYRQQYAGRTVVPVSDPLTSGQLEELAGLGPLTLLALTGTGTSWLSAVGLVRATRAAARLLPDAVVVSVPLAAHGDPDADHALGVQVVEAFAAGDPVHALRDDEDGEHPAEVAAVVDHDRPPADRQGLVVFFTGLSGSGKSTLARAFVDLLLEQGVRTVTSLDGDVVRRNLSAGLTFSKEDRETNIRRIGWVAAEISRHGGVAVVSPIAPFDETRQQVRAMVDDAGGAFFLVHVATPLEECERRDRKGLYAKARAGQIPEFTGISSPYDEPQDADVRVDTTGRTIDDALHDVLVGLRDAGYVDLVGDEPDASRPAGTGPLEVLFVCTANICRSPSLELMARAALGPGRPGPVLQRRHPRLRGRAHRRDARRRAARGHRLLGVPQPPGDAGAPRARPTWCSPPRPRTGSSSSTSTRGCSARSSRSGSSPRRSSRAPDDLDRAGLLAHVATSRGNADPALDVPDPYRQGAEAASGCVARLDELLHVVLPALSR